MRKQNPLRSIRDAAAVSAAKAVSAASRLAGNQGSSLPGKTAMKLAPSVLTDLARQVRKATFAVCGTNGKTTTNNLLCAMLEAGGYTVVCNRLGANMLNGIAGAYTAAAGAGGHLDADYACLEIDEASAVRVFPYVRPDYLILTNLFRDQLDRYGEIDITIDLLKKAIQQVPDMKLIVNADDPFSVYLAMETGNPAVYYGMPDPISCGRNSETGKNGDQAAQRITGYGGSGEEDTEIRESGFCKRCGAPLQYAFYHFSQVGMYRCSACSFRRPEARYEARDVCLSGEVSFTVENCRIQSGLAGAYSVYNLLAVWSALRESGADSRPVPEENCPGRSLPPDGKDQDLVRTAERFNETLRHFQTQFGRNEHFLVNGREVILNLAKNPAGFNQNIDAMLEDKRPKDLLIVINDNEQDGTDVSWLWDVDFDRIRDRSVRSVIVSGIRALDMGLRLKYVDIDAAVTESPEEALERLLDNKSQGKAAEGPDGNGTPGLYVLVNYTALFPIHRYLLKKENGKMGKTIPGAGQPEHARRGK